MKKKKIIVPVIRLCDPWFCGLSFAAVSSRGMLSVDSRIDKSWSVRAGQGTLYRVERELANMKNVARAFVREICIEAIIKFR